MLGFGGRGGRREFIGGMALLAIGPMPYGMGVTRLLLPWMETSLEPTVFVPLALALGALTVALIVLWIWGAAALATRRARDIGWPAWIGAPLMAVGCVVASLTNLGALGGLIGFMAVLPSRDSRARRAKPLLAGR